ncbi:hypothetical protein PHMEG_00026303, partial [Phytophthora megakarya]
VRGNLRKRPQHHCIVCSVRRQILISAVPPGFTAMCAANATNDSLSYVVIVISSVYICATVSCPGNSRNNTAISHRIWHLVWKNGAECPEPGVGRGIQMRGLGRAPLLSKTGESKESDARDAQAGDCKMGAFHR